MANEAFQLVVVVLAAVTTLYLCINSGITLRRAVRENSLNDSVSLFSLAALWLSSHMWCLYGVVTSNVFPLIITYGIGDTLCMLYLSVYIYYSTDKRRAVAMCSCALVLNLALSIFAVLGMLGVVLAESFHLVQNIVGFSATGASFLLFSSPFSAMVKTVKTKSSDALPLGMCLTGTVCNGLWTVYAASIQDMLQLVPVSIFLSIGIVQLGLYGFYHPSRQLGSNGVAALADCNLVEAGVVRVSVDDCDVIVAGTERASLQECDLVHTGIEHVSVDEWDLAMAGTKPESLDVVVTECEATDTSTESSYSEVSTPRVAGNDFASSGFAPPTQRRASEVAAPPPIAVLG